MRKGNKIVRRHIHGGGFPASVHFIPEDFPSVYAPGRIESKLSPQLHGFPPVKLHAQKIQSLARAVQLRKGSVFYHDVIIFFRFISIPQSFRGGGCLLLTAASRKQAAETQQQQKKEFFHTIHTISFTHICPAYYPKKGWPAASLPVSLFSMGCRFILCRW